MTFAELKRQFLESLAQDRGRSEKTIENYNRYLTRFFEFVKVAKPSDLTEEHIKEFQRHLKEQPGTKNGRRFEPMKQSTQNYYLIAVRTFLKFLGERGITSLGHKQIKLAKAPERSLDLISSSELKRLLSAPDTKELEGKRDKAILELLCSSGIRISELTNLSIDDINLMQDEFTVLSRGGKIRTIFLSDSTKKALQKYLKNRKDMHDAMFVRYGRKMNDGGDSQLSPRAVQRLVKKYAVQVGITRKVTPQVIRNSFATDLLSSGADLHSAQAHLGHSSIGTTRAYAKTTKKSLVQEHSSGLNK